MIAQPLPRPPDPDDWIDGPAALREVAAYLAFERQSPQRHEFVDGRVRAMSGASRDHNLIALNIAAELRQQLRGRPCETYVGDMRVKVAASGLYTYPDVVVCCDGPRFEDAVLDTLLNPSLIVEVLSPSTEAYDRGAKFDAYRQLASLRDYVIVAQDRLWVACFTRRRQAWLLVEHRDRQAVLTLPSIGCRLELDGIYERVRPEGGAAAQQQAGTAP